MTLQILLGFVAVLSVFFTLILRNLYKIKVNWIISLLQNFCGFLFLVSGFVKAADPLGTAYKMTDYFNEFIHHFQGTWFSFLRPLFSQLSEWSVPVALFMIVFEMLLGIMLILGLWRKTTSILFFALVIFFTVLTGFTYLTAYVPNEATFFQFGKWLAFNETNMRVTDCGCFGDFLVLSPATSFAKDVFLLIPAIIFLFFYSKMHVIPGAFLRYVVTGLVGLGSLVFCLSNYVWDIPSMDFRPFKVGTNVAAVRAAEKEASQSISILGFKLKNLVNDEIIEIGYDQYMSNYAQYPKEEWSVIDQIKTEPSIPPTKISELIIESLAGEDITEDVLTQERPVLLIVSSSLKYSNTREENYTSQEEIFTYDTIENGDDIDIIKVIDTVINREATRTVYDWENSTQKIFGKVDEAVASQELKNVDKIYLVGKASGSMLEYIQERFGRTLDVDGCEDLTLKTMIRSNPGFILMDNGVILGKWHHKKFKAQDAAALLQ